MTDNEIKALKVLASWQKLAYHNDDGTDEDSHELYEALVTVFALINRQKAEIERLQTEVKLLTENSISAKYPHCALRGNGVILTKSLEEYDRLITDIEAEAVKEFAERVCEDRVSNDPVVIAVKTELELMKG